MKRLRLPIILCSCSLLALAVAIAFPILRPASTSATTETLAGLDAQLTELAPFNEKQLAELEKACANLRVTLWNDQTLSFWRKSNIPEGWILQDLGSNTGKNLVAHRFAFTRPEATDSQWTEIIRLIQTLESTPAVIFQTVSLTAQPGLSGSRKFSQCTIIATFLYPKT